MLPCLPDRNHRHGWLGLTLSCARCHNHKYDAIPQSDYYRLFAFFNNADETNYDLPLIGAPCEIQRGEGGNRGGAEGDRRRD